MKFRSLALIASATIMLGGCASTASFTGVMQRATISDPGHPGRIKHVRAIVEQVDFPDGETHNISVIDELNPRTGRPLPRGRGQHVIYASNGENMNRTMAKIFVGSILPAAIVGGSNIGAAEILHGGGLVLNNNVSSASAAVARSVARVHSTVSVKH